MHHKVTNILKEEKICVATKLGGDESLKILLFNTNLRNNTVSLLSLVRCKIKVTLEVDNYEAQTPFNIRPVAYQTLM